MDAASARESANRSPQGIPPGGCVRRSPMTQRAAALLAVTLLTLGLLGAPAVADEPRAIAFNGFEQAIEDARQREAVLAVYFTAEWCGVCHRMERTTFRDADVIDAARPFAWARVDIDAAPAIAGAFAMRGVPAIALLNAHGELLTIERGYMGPQRLIAVLEQYRDAAHAPGAVRQHITELVGTTQRLVDADADELIDAVVEAVTLLSGGEAIGHGLPRREILSLGPRAWPGLVEALGHERLAVRAAGYELLVESTQRPLAFDPFADADARAAQHEQWQQWLEAQTIAPADEADQAADDAEPDPDASGAASRQDG